MTVEVLEGERGTDGRTGVEDRRAEDAGFDSCSVAERGVGDAEDAEGTGEAGEAGDGVDGDGSVSELMGSVQ